MTVPTITDPEAAGTPVSKPADSRPESALAKVIRALLTQRIVLLAVLIVVVVVVFMVMGSNGYLTADYDSDYLAGALINAVPLGLAGFRRTAGDPFRPRRHRPVGGRQCVPLGNGLRVRLRPVGLAAVVGDRADGAVRRAPRRRQRIARRLHRFPRADRDSRDVLRVQVAGRGDQQSAADQHQTDPGPVRQHRQVRRAAR